jgi:hypothetical protein
VNNYEAQLEQLRTKVQAALKADHPPSTHKCVERLSASLDQLSTELYEVTGGVQVPLDHRIEYKQRSRKLFRQTKLELDSMIERYLNPSSNLVELGTFVLSCSS